MDSVNVDLDKLKLQTDDEKGEEVETLVENADDQVVINDPDAQKEQEQEDSVKQEDKKIEIQAGINKNKILSEKTWDDHKLNSQLIKNLTANDYIKPSKIQDATLQTVNKKLKKGLFLLGQSQNGSGKTLAFLLAGLIRVNPNLSTFKGKYYAPQFVILATTKELINQIYDITCKLTYDTNIKVGRLASQVETQDAHVFIGTVEYFCNQVKNGPKKSVVLDQLVSIAIDEADQILEDEKQKNALQTCLIKNLPQDVHFLCFSATFTQELTEQLKNDKFYYLDPTTITLSQTKKQLTLEGVNQMYLLVKEEKSKILEDILNKLKDTQAIIFCENRNKAISTMEYLRQKKFSVALLMGRPMTNYERELTIKKFRDNKFNVLITTNVVARGFDQRQVRLVINQDIPVIYNKPNEVDYDTYLHRIGRTGRFGDTGIALNLIGSQSEENQMKQIQKYYNIENLQKLEDLDSLQTYVDQCIKKSKEIQQ